MKDQGDATPMPTTLGSLLFKDYYPEPRFLRGREAEKSRRDYSRQSDSRRARRRRHPWFAVRLDEESLRPGTHRRRLLGRLGRQRIGELLHGRRRPGRLRVDPPAIDVERRRRHAPDGRPGQPRRRLRRLAFGQRLPRPDGAYRHRLGEAAGHHGRLRSRRSSDGARRRSDCRTAFTKFLDQNGLKGARIGILRESMGYDAEPGSRTST